MKNRILENLTIAVVWVNIAKWISGISLAVSGFARFINNEEESVLNYLQKIFSLNNQMGIIRKPAQAAGWRRLLIKKAGILTKSIRDNITTVFVLKIPAGKIRKPFLSAACVNW